MAVTRTWGASSVSCLVLESFLDLEQTAQAASSPKSPSTRAAGCAVPGFTAATPATGDLWPTLVFSWCGGAGSGCWHR